MADNEIIKALECYSCMEDGLHENAIDLIKRQQTTIELLTKENDEVFDSYTQSVWHRDKQIKEAIKEFAEKLKSYNHNEFIHSWYESADLCYEFDDSAYEIFIDKLVKEMVGD